MAAVVPETPDASLNRRSRRRSTMIATMATNSAERRFSLSRGVSRIIETPETSRTPTAAARTRVEESPALLAPKRVLARDFDDLDFFRVPEAVRHPIFSPRQKNAAARRSSLVEWVPATQEEVAKTDKVERWLENIREGASTTPTTKNPGRRSTSSGSDLINNFCQFLINKESSDDGEKRDDTCKTPDSSGQTRNRRLSKLFTDQIALSSPAAKASLPNSASVTLKDDFTNFSTESAKELMTRMEAEARRLGGSSADEAMDVDRNEGVGGAPRDAPPAAASTSTSIAPATPTTATPRPEVNPRLLEGVVAFVEVRSLHENRSRCVEDQLKSFGAKVSPKLGPGVTHMVFKDGALSNYNKAKKLGIHIVSASWIEACKKAGEKVPEAQFPTSGKEKYDSPSLFPRLRKVKSFQPKTDEEIQKKMEERLKKNLKKREAKELKERREKEEKSQLLLKSQYPESLDYYNSPSLTLRKQQEKQEREDIIKLLLDGDAPQEASSPSRSSPRRDETLPGSPCWSDECNLPLFKILARRAAKRRSAVGISAGETPTTSLAALRLESPAEATSSVSVSSGGDQKSTAESSCAASTGRGRSRGKRKAEEAESSPQAEADEAAAVSAGSEGAAPSVVQPVVARRRVLYTQTSMLAVTPTGTPIPESNVEKKPAPKATRKKTRLIKNNSVIVAEPPKAPEIAKTEISKTQQSDKFEVRIAKKRDAVPRRSSIDFLAAKPKTRFRKPLDPGGLIACTSCHSEQYDAIKQIVGSLGKFRFAKAFSDKTTHVVCGDESRRTLNLLRGILSGCWIVSSQWVTQSLEAGRWLDEEPFELTAFSEAVRTQRLEREAFGPKVFRSELFADCGSLYFARGCRAPVNELQQLAELGAGRLARLARVADVVVGKSVEGAAAVCVDERWLLDSIQKHSVMPLQDYLL